MALIERMDGMPLRLSSPIPIDSRIQGDDLPESREARPDLHQVAQPIASINAEDLPDS